MYPLRMSDWHDSPSGKDSAPWKAVGEYFTIGWNTLEGIVAVVAERLQEAFRLLGLGSTALLKLFPVSPYCGECRWMPMFSAEKGTKGWQWNCRSCFLALAVYIG